MSQATFFVPIQNKRENRYEWGLLFIQKSYSRDADGRDVDWMQQGRNREFRITYRAGSTRNS
ncbi:MAG: hypothetical protein K5900_09965 [Butyrivibrio sp.]|nr:hypothetical protein [Butyrivibrio sp.]